MKWAKNRLLLFVAAFSLILHGLGIYFLCDLSLSGSLSQLRKNPFSFPMSGLADEKMAEVLVNNESIEPIDAMEEKLSQFDLKSLFSLTKEEFFCEDPKPIATSPALLADDSTLLASLDEAGSRDLLGIDESTDFSSLDLVDFSHSKDKEISSGEHFTYQLEYAPRRFRAGYVFKISLLPKTDVSLKRMKQNYFFLVDRSNSIPRARFFLNKKAIAATLKTLPKEDHFNILVFDDKMMRFSNDPLQCTDENIEKAKNFLDNLSHGGYFATTDIYASLGRILPRLVSDTEINTAILLSDGDTYLTLENQRLLIRNWSEANSGKVTLFCLASGTGNNLTLLEMISAFNKGAFIYVSDHKQIDERLVQLVNSLKHPIGKEISITALSLSKEKTPILLPKAKRLPDLYKDRPYVIYGSTNKLEDFTLFLQGKFYDRKFDLVKKISFSSARLGTLDLERKYTTLLVQDYFEQFFKDGKTAHLEAAKQLLSPLDMAVPFLH